LVWGIIPDFWSISGSGLILGGAIWVAVAKSRIKHDNQDDLERNEYVAVDGEENAKDEFELGELDDDEDVAESSSTPSSTPEERPNRDIAREEENMNIAGDGELAEVTHWRESD
jgi:hypothetical protein